MKVTCKAGKESQSVLLLAKYVSVVVVVALLVVVFLLAVGLVGLTWLILLNLILFPDLVSLRLISLFIFAEYSVSLLCLCLCDVATLFSCFRFRS